MFLNRLQRERWAIEFSRKHGLAVETAVAPEPRAKKLHKGTARHPGLLTPSGELPELPCLPARAEGSVPSPASLDPRPPVPSSPNQQQAPCLGKRILKNLHQRQIRVNGPTFAVPPGVTVRTRKRADGGQYEELMCKVQIPVAGVQIKRTACVRPGDHSSPKDAVTAAVGKLEVISEEARALAASNRYVCEVAQQHAKGKSSNRHRKANRRATTTREIIVRGQPFQVPGGVTTCEKKKGTGLRVHLRSKRDGKVRSTSETVAQARARQKWFSRPCD